MKTAVSIPQPVFESAERLGRRLKKSRSQLYAEAVAEYVARRDPESITDAMNAVCAEIDTRADAFVQAAARRTFERTEW